jgi:hypothetical protein
MSALATISNKEELIQRVCVERDEAVGVYGFVFHRGKHKTPQSASLHTHAVQMASGSPRSSMTSYTSLRRTLTRLRLSDTIG